MATIKQKKALDNLVGNGGNVTKAMIDADYSINTANTPQKLTESIGFKQLCEEQGLTDKLLISALVEDIKSKKKNRKAELELGFKVKGRLKEDEEKEKSVPVININFIGLTDNKHRPNSKAERGVVEVVRRDN